MMIEDNSIAKTAKLAGLEFSSEEQKQFSREIAEILNYMQKLSECDLSDILPLYQVNEESDVLREDKPGVTLTKEEVFRNAPQVETDFFSVPIIIKQV